MTFKVGDHVEIITKYTSIKNMIYFGTISQVETNIFGTIFLIKDLGLWFVKEELKYA